MGFLNKFLKGLGFEDEENSSKQVENKKKVKKEKIKTNNSGYASYNLNQEEKPKEVEVDQEVTAQVEDTELQPSGGFSIVKVKTQVEVQGVVDKVKRGEKVLINLTGMSGVDITRSLDFLTGVVYALDKTMQKVDGNVYLIQ